jgi:flagellar biosynthetic protein FlhB
MSDTNDAASKTEEPTGRKIAQARERGEVVKTPDLASLASLAGAASVVVLAGGWLSRNMMAQLTPFLSSPRSRACAILRPVGSSVFDAASFVSLMAC